MRAPQSFHWLFIAIALIAAACGVLAAGETGDKVSNDKQGALETLSLTLRGNPTTGYSWSWTASGDGAVRETGHTYQQDDERLMGAPGVFVYSFVGEKEGEVVLRFVYSRPWEERNPDDLVKIYRLLILPDKRICISGDE